MTEPSPEKKFFKDPLTRSPSYIPADRYTEFLQWHEFQSLRIELDLLKPELIQREQRIPSTVSAFGSTMLLKSASASETLQLAEVAAAGRPNDSSCQQQAALARRQLNLSAYYDAAREFGRLVSSSCQVDGRCDFVIVVGRGPSITEAANCGPADTYAKSIGLNVTLPRKQQPNPYISSELSSRLRYFAIRKMHFMIRAEALVTFLGEFGSLDEFFETLALLQAGKTAKGLVVLIGRGFWQGLINRLLLGENGLISRSDLQLFHYAETTREAWDPIGHHDGMPLS